MEKSENRFSASTLAVPAVLLTLQENEWQALYSRCA